MQTPNEPPAQEQAPLKTFDEILKNETLVKSLATLGISTPTPVQQATLPLGLMGKDMIAQAKTGSGKTLVFVLPLLLQIEKSNDDRSTQGIIITPTRELAVQICEVISSISKDIAPVCIIGGASVNAQIKGLKEDRRIIVGTPGRLLDLIKQREITLRKCAYFAVDEADEMFSMNFVEDVRAILSRLPANRQGLFISATMSPRVEMLANNFLNKPEKIVINSEKDKLPPIEHLYVDVDGEITAKVNALCDIIETQRPRSAIIFCNTKSDTELVEVFLRRRGFDARRINSDLNQRQRDAIMSKIRAQELQFLIGTDIAARGLDIEQIDLIVNYSIHDTAESYVHRTGRTGRAGRSGRAISLVGPQDFSAFSNLKKTLEVNFIKMPLPEESEVVDARTAHFHEILRNTKKQPSTKDITLAQKLLFDLGGITEPTEELSTAIAKMYQFSIEFIAKQESKGLDEEIQAAERPQTKERDSYSDSNRDRRSHHSDRSYGDSRRSGSRNGGNRSRR